MLRLLGVEAVGTAGEVGTCSVQADERHEPGPQTPAATAAEGFESPAPAKNTPAPAPLTVAQPDAPVVRSAAERLEIARAALAGMGAVEPPPAGEVPAADDFEEPALAYHAEEDRCPHCDAKNPEPGIHHHEKRCARHPGNPGHARYRRDRK